MKILLRNMMLVLAALLALGGGQAVWAATRAVQLQVAGCHT